MLLYYERKEVPSETDAMEHRVADIRSDRTLTRLVKRVEQLRKAQVPFSREVAKTTNVRDLWLSLLAVDEFCFASIKKVLNYCVGGLSLLI